MRITAVTNKLIDLFIEDFIRHFFHFCEKLNILVLIPKNWQHVQNLTSWLSFVGAEGDNNLGKLRVVWRLLSFNTPKRAFVTNLFPLIEHFLSNFSIYSKCRAAGWCETFKLEKFLKILLELIHDNKVVYAKYVLNNDAKVYWV